MNCIYCFKSNVISDIWWSVLVEVVAAIYSTTENSVKRQWLLDALDVGCVAEHPLTVIIQDVLLESVIGYFTL